MLPYTALLFLHRSLTRNALSIPEKAKSRYLENKDKIRIIFLCQRKA